VIGKRISINVLAPPIPLPVPARLTSICPKPFSRELPNRLLLTLNDFGRQYILCILDFKGIYIASWYW
jgi:hypothetical protein